MLDGTYEYKGYPVAMARAFSYNHIGEGGMLFGIRTYFGGAGWKMGDPAPPATHIDCANGLFWDGHCATVHMPESTSAEKNRILKQLSANHSGIRETYPPQ